MISIGSIKRLIMFAHGFAHYTLSGSAARLLSWSATRSLDLVGNTVGDSVGEVSRLTCLKGFSPGCAPTLLQYDPTQSGQPHRINGVKIFLQFK